MKHPALPKWLVIIMMVIGALILFAIIGNVASNLKGNNSVSQTNSVSDGYGSAQKGLAIRGTPANYAVEEMAYDSAPSAAPPMAESSIIMPDAGGSAAVDADGHAVTQRIIKNGELELRVQDTSQAMTAVQTLMSEKNGFVESSSISDSGEGARTAYMTLRIPAASFESVVSELKSISTLVLYEATTGQDVTMEFVDLEADLKNAEAEEDSYRAILSRSGSIEEVLAVTRQLAETRGRIERLEGRKRYLENLTDLATIQLTLTEETRIDVPTRTWKPYEVLRQSVRELIEGLQAFVDFLIQFVISVVGLLIPVFAFVGIVIWLGWKAIRWYIRKLKR